MGLHRAYALKYIKNSLRSTTIDSEQHLSTNYRSLPLYADNAFVSLCLV